MRTKMVSYVICAFMIATTFVVAEPTNTNAETSSMIEYQIGVRLANRNDNWSPWNSDGAIARVTTYGMSAPMDFLIRINAPGYHVDYQIGIRLATRDDNWSPWSSDGEIARVNSSGLSGTMDFILRIEAPGYHVEYQIGVRKSNQLNDSWSLWSSDGEIARVTTYGFTGTMEFMMKARLIPPTPAIIDIDPDTLNLKSKGNWITCYIDLPGYDVNEIDISTILLEDTIPAEWGDIQGDTLMVKFDRSEVEDMLPVGTYNLKVTGELIDGTSFEGYSDEIRVIDPGK